MSIILNIKNIKFSYEENDVVLDKISFQLAKNKILGIAGESGSGKSTLLHAIYGLIDLNSGEIFFENKKVTGPAFNLIPGQSEMRFAGQKVNLQSSVSIIDQIKYKLLRYQAKFREKKAIELLKLVGLENKKDSYPNHLSGGQQQLVNLCCSLAEEPKLLLLDEPFNNLDQNAKTNLKKYLLDLKNTLSLSIIIVSHDPVDLLSISDELIVLKNGKIIQKDSPENIYFQPKNNYVAQLFGEINIVQKKTKKIFVRPSRIQISTAKKSGFVIGEITAKSFHGGYYLYQIKTKSHSTVYVSSGTLFTQKNIWIKP